MVGYWATLSLNIPDFTRYAKSRTRRSWDRPSACRCDDAVLFYRDRVHVGIDGGLRRAYLESDRVAGQLSSAARGVSGADRAADRDAECEYWGECGFSSNDFSNLAPTLISFRTGGLITGFLGLAMMPWKLMATFGSYIFGWLVGYSGLLGPVAGIMVADYFFIRGKRLDREIRSTTAADRTSIRSGINPRAIDGAGGRSFCRADRAVCSVAALAL